MSSNCEADGPVAIAPLWRRCCASVIDAVIILIWIFLAVAGLTVHGENVQIWLALLLVYALPVLILSAKGAADSATYGMQKLNISFVDSRGDELGLIRTGARILLGFLLIPLFPVSIIVFISTRRQKTFSDLTCHTLVIVDRRESPSGSGFDVLVDQ